MSTTIAQTTDDGFRFQVTFWPGRPAKTPPGTIILPPAWAIDPERQARDLVREWRRFRERGVDLSFPAMPKRRPRVVHLIVRARGHTPRPRRRLTARRCSCSSRADPDDDPACEERHRHAKGGAS